MRWRRRLQQTLTWIEDRNEVLYNLDTDTSIPANTSSGCVFYIYKPNINRLWENSLKMAIFCLIMNAWFKSGRFRHGWLCHTNLSHYETYAVFGIKPGSHRFV